MSRRRGIVLDVACCVNDNNSIAVTYKAISNTTRVSPAVHGSADLSKSYIYSSCMAEDKINGVLESIKAQIKTYYEGRENAFDIAEKMAGNYSVNREEVEKKS